MALAQGPVREPEPARSAPVPHAKADTKSATGHVRRQQPAAGGGDPSGRGANAAKPAASSPTRRATREISIHSTGSSMGRIRRSAVADQPYVTAPARATRVVPSQVPTCRTGLVQRQIIPDGQPGAGTMEAAERVSLDGLLRHNDFDPAAFTAPDYDTLTVAYSRIAPLEAKVGKSKANKKLQAKQELKTAYDGLMKKIAQFHLCVGHADFDAGVTLAVERFRGLETAQQKNTDAVYQTVAGQLWPNVNGRGAMPDSFWKAVRQKARAAYAAAVAAAGPFSEQCNTVYADMNAQFERWDGSKKNRGAWWGSDGPGNPAGAKAVPTSIIVELQRKVSAAWRVQNSFTGGVSFHRPGAQEDFIYHMLPP